VSGELSHSKIWVHFFKARVVLSDHSSLSGHHFEVVLARGLTIVASHLNVLVGEQMQLRSAKR
jgi:hypothetical protein